MSTFEKMKALKELLGDKYYYYLGTMLIDGFEVKESVDFLYYQHFIQTDSKLQNKLQKRYTVRK